MASTTVSTGMTLEYEVHGDGDPLLLVMGLGGQLVAWPSSFIAGLVDRGFKVITFDNRDIGLSTKIDAAPPTKVQSAMFSISRRFAKSAYLLSDMAKDAVGLLDALNIERAHVVGMSMGGMIAQTMAIEHPSRVRSLTSIMSTTGNPRVGRPKTSVVVRALKLTGGSKETFADRQAALFKLFSGSLYDELEIREVAKLSVERNFTPDGTARQMAAIMASPDRTPQLKKLNVPTLVVHGLEDGLVQPSGGHATTKAIPGARLLAFPDMGHNLPQARIPEILDEIKRNTLRS
ncbi:MAG: alpha/beta hydrolase [Actinomycetes bacterium]